MRLVDLDPEFLVFERDGERKFFRTVDTIAQAQGIKFLCPKCFAQNGGPAGTHSVICWSRSRGTPDDVEPLPGRWTFEGSGFADLTLNGDPPGGARSVALGGGCDWHGFITNGEAA